MERKLLAAMGFAVVMLIGQTAGAGMLLDEYYDYGGSNLDSGYGAWQDGTGRVGYVANQNLGFANAAYDEGGNTNTGAHQASSGPGDLRGAQLAVSAEQAGAFWVSALVRMTADLDENDAAFITFNTSDSYGYAAPGGDGIGIGVADPSGNLAPAIYDNGTGSPVFGADTTFAANTAYLLLAELSIGPGDDTIDLWLLKEGDTFGPTKASLGPADLSISDANLNDGLKNIWVGRYPSNGTIIDAIRISDSAGNAGLAQVLVPEPTSIILLTLGGMLCVRRRAA